MLTSAECLPSSHDSKEKERQNVFSVLKDNGYPKNFLPNYCKPVTSSRSISVEKVSTAGFVVVSQIRGVTEPIKRISASHNVKVAQKRFQTLNHIFSKTKDCVPREQRTDSVYSIPCKDCGHVYIGQTRLPNQPYSWNNSEIITPTGGIINTFVWKVGT